MNIFKKIYCRSFQTVFKIALPFLPYRKPKIVSALSDIPSVLNKKKKSCPIIITDPGIAKLGILSMLTDVFDNAGIEYHVYDKTVANPTTDTVEEALAIYKDNKCDCIIGFGGGSSMDCAKAVGVRIARPKTHLSKLGGILKVHAKLPLLVAIPTTAGTGSETTLAAVIVDATTRHKYAINDFPLIPRYAVLDPKVTLTLPASITATTGMDALTHAVEAYIGNSTTPGTRKDALMAAELIFNNLDRAYTNGSDTTARKNMLKAAYYAGCAFTKSYVGYIHAIAHSLGGEYNVPHGLAIAAGVADKDMSDESASKIFIQAIKDMKSRFNIGDTISEIKEEDIPKLAGYADKEANPLYPVPVLMDAKTLEQFYYKLMNDNTLKNEV